MIHLYLFFSLKDLLASKRKQRAENNTFENDRNDNDEENSNQGQGISNLIPNIITKGNDNSPFVNDEENQSENTEKDLSSQSAIFNNHRDRSKELTKRIKEEDQNVVVEQLKDVRERIKDKLKSNIIDNLSKVREEGETSKKDNKIKEDLKLDLTSSIKDDNLGQTILSGTDNSIKERIKRIQVFHI